MAAQNQNRNAQNRPNRPAPPTVADVDVFDVNPPGVDDLDADGLDDPDDAGGAESGADVAAESGIKVLMSLTQKYNISADDVRKGILIYNGIKAAKAGKLNLKYTKNSGNIPAFNGKPDTVVISNMKGDYLSGVKDGKPAFSLRLISGEKDTYPPGGCLFLDLKASQFYWDPNRALAGHVQTGRGIYCDLEDTVSLAESAKPAPAAAKPASAKPAPSADLEDDELEAGSAESAENLDTATALQLQMFDMLLGIADNDLQGNILQAIADSIREGDDEASLRKRIVNILRK